ncbi:MAG: hypothetical protein ACTSRW_07870 [Candidatus Helarchaeota archaeon]
MKSIHLSVLEPKIVKLLSDELVLQVDDEATLFDIIAQADKILTEKNDGDFPITKIKCLLQLFWNPISEEFYGDIALESRDAENNWLRLRKFPYMKIPDGSRFVLVPDAGC